MKKIPHILAFLLICTALPIQSQSRLTAKTKVLIGTLVSSGITLILGVYGLKKYRAHKNSSDLQQPLLTSKYSRFDEDETKLLTRILSDDSPHLISILINQGANPNADIQDPNDSKKSISLLDVALRSKNPFENIQALIIGGAVVTKQTIDYAKKKGTSAKILTLLERNLDRVEFDELWLHEESDFTCDYIVLEE